jgi:hypothetical protein
MVKMVELVAEPYIANEGSLFNFVTVFNENKEGYRIVI